MRIFPLFQRENVYISLISEEKYVYFPLFQRKNAYISLITEEKCVYFLITEEKCVYFPYYRGKMCIFPLLQRESAYPYYRGKMRMFGTAILSRFPLKSKCYLCYKLSLDLWSWYFRIFHGSCRSISVFLFSCGNG